MRGLLALAAAAALWALPALADPAEVPPDVFLATQGEDQFLAKDLLLGAKVHNADGQIIGDVEDLILNADNQVVGVVMGVGGFAGFGEKRVGVRLSALQITNEDGKITVALPQATKEVLDALAPFKRTAPPMSLLDRAIEKAKELTDKSRVTAGDAYERAKDEAGPLLQRAREAAEETLDRVREETGPALKKTGEAVEKAYQSARESVEGKPVDQPDAATPPGSDNTATEKMTPDAPAASQTAPQEPAANP